MSLGLLKNSEEWDKWVENNPQARYVYLSGYLRAVEETFSLPLFPLIYREHQTIKAIFPAFLTRNLCGERILVSLPFSEYGGPLGEDEKGKLIETLEEIVKNLKVKYVEIHGGIGIKKTEKYKRVPICSRCTLNLYGKNLEEIYLSLDRSVKKNLRKAKNWGLKIERLSRIPLPAFTSLYLISHKRLGSPPLPLEFFERLNDYLSSHIRCVLITFKGKPISLLLGWSVGITLHITHILSHHHYWFTRANDIAHWEMIKWAWEEGKKIFDFGPARYEGQTRYKKKWGTKFYPYFYFYYPPGISKSPPLPQKGIWKLLGNTWRYTIPLKLTPVLGKVIRPRLGI